eukprot:5207597-Pleurochrysis_carterae.AAC.1
MVIEGSWDIFKVFFQCAQEARALLPGDRERLMNELWSGEWALSSSPMASANAEMCEFFEMHSLDNAESRKHCALSNRSRSRWEGRSTVTEGSRLRKAMHH